MSSKLFTDLDVLLHRQRGGYERAGGNMHAITGSTPTMHEIAYKAPGLTPKQTQTPVTKKRPKTKQKTTRKPIKRLKPKPKTPKKSCKLDVQGFN